RQVVQQCGKANMLIFFRCSPYTLQSRQHGLLGVDPVGDSIVFSLVRPLPSSNSSALASFVAFSGTMGRSDSSAAFVSGLRLPTFPDRSVWFFSDTAEV